MIRSHNPDTATRPECADHIRSPLSLRIEPHPANAVPNAHQNEGCPEADPLIPPRPSAIYHSETLQFPRAKAANRSDQNKPAESAPSDSPPARDSTPPFPISPSQKHPQATVPIPGF